jgi:hypothetical protein
MLEIHVFDKVIIVEDLERVHEVLIGVLKRWHDGEDRQPLNIQIKKKDNKAPPALEISVRDEVITRGAFG